MHENSDPISAPRQRHQMRKLTVGLLLAEAGLLFAGALYSVATLMPQGAEVRTFGIGLGVFLGVFGLMVVLAAKSLWNFGRYGVSFGVTWQLFQALVGASIMRGGFIIAGLATLSLAVALFVLLLKPYNKPDRELLFSEQG